MIVSKTDANTLRELVRKYGPYELDHILRNINSSVHDEEEPTRRKEYADRREQYQKRKAEEDRIGKVIAETLEPGMIVKVRGTKNNGVRLVVEVGKYQILGHHLVRSSKGGFKKGSYVTTHGFDKIVKVLENIVVK